MNIADFIEQQLAVWPEAAAHHKALTTTIATRRLDTSKRTVTLQHNPDRAISTCAAVDAETIAARRCFLCRDNRPEEQTGIMVDSYDILVNPFPIFPNHLTIASREHVCQRLDSRFKDMLFLAEILKDNTILYNGPACGASAPDHMHFQAAPTEYFPIWNDIDRTPSLYSSDGYYVFDVLPAVYVMAGNYVDGLSKHFQKLLNRLPMNAAAGEPDMNVLVRHTDNMFHVMIIPRKKHRPECYGYGDGQHLISPGTIDMAGVIITPRRSDFDTLTPSRAEEILKDVSYPASELIKFLQK